MPKKPSRKTLKNKADRLFSLFIRARDGACVCCGSTENLQCAHGFSRRYLKTRWDERNAWALCNRHHLYFTHHPIEWDVWMEQRLGPTEYRLLRLDAIATGYSIDYESIIAELQDKLEEVA